MTIAEVKPEGTNELRVTLYGETVSACGFVTATTRPRIFFTIPRAVGQYPLRFDLSSLGSTSNRTLTFYDPNGSRNVISGNGIINVEAVSDTSVTIGLVADASSQNVNGRFTATLCGD